jgi:alpha-tubulin suppressor-like RCC1 family protein
VPVSLLSLLLVVFAASSASATSGQLYGFGENAAGQLASTAGNGGASPNPIPALLAFPGATGPIVESAAGGRFALALTSTNQLYAFGSNLFGQLGVASSSGTPSPNPTPQMLALPGASGRVAQIAAGAAHALVLTSAGELFTFGENRFGQLGRTDNAGSEAPNRVPERIGLPGASGQVTQIAAGCEHSLALTSTGQLYTFGGNRYGQLGRAANAGSGTPNPTPSVVTLPGASGPVRQIAAGCEHSLALTSTGQLYTFGGNRYGQLGRAANADTAIPNPTPAQVSLPSGGSVTAIAAGGFHTLALSSGGPIYAFGRNQDGQLGNASTSGEEGANPTPTRVTFPAASAPPVSIVAGNEHSLAITASGELFTFGSNLVGQLGRAVNSGASAPNPTPARAALPVGTTIDTVARGSTADFTLAQVADLAVLNGSLPAGQVGVPYATSAVAAGSVGGYAWGASGLPAGLAIDPSSGQISGTPTTAGTTGVVLTVTDAFGVSASSATMLVTIAPRAPTRAFLSTALTEAQIRASLRQQLGIKGSGARVASLRKRRSYTYGFTALTAGTLAIDWYYLPPGARLAARNQPILFARGRASFANAGTKRITLKLTATGRRLVRQRRRLAIVAKGSFTPRGKRAVTATKGFALAR